MLLQFLPLALVLAGAALLVGGLRHVRRIIAASPPRARRWRLLLYFIALFLLAYLAFAATLVGAPSTGPLLIAAAVFFGGACFVFIVTRLSERSIDDLARVSALERENRRMSMAEQRLKGILESAAEAILIFEDDGSIDDANTAAERLLGFDRGELVGKPIDELVVADRRDTGGGAPMETGIGSLLESEREAVALGRDGRRIPVAIKVSVSQMPDRRLYVALVSDITERKALFRQLKYMAEHDPLTGLFNRAYLEQEATRALQRASAVREHGVAMLYIDLDNFKEINDRWGHTVGDRLLVEVAERLSRCSRGRDVTARVGGDEFVVLVDEVARERVLDIAESFRERIVGHRFEGEDGQPVQIGCSIGVAFIEGREVSFAEALKQADHACYLAKRGGRNCLHLFTASDEDRAPHA